MVLLDDDIYQETKQIVLGKQKRHPLINELAVWLARQYSVKLLNIQFSKLNTPGINRYRLYLILNSTEDYAKMHRRPLEPNEEYQGRIWFEFRRLALKHKYADESKLEDVLVIYNDFSEEARTEANWKAIKEAGPYLKNKYPVVWDVVAMFSGSVVFYYLDADITINENKGTSKMIMNDYYSILKKYDEIKYFTRENISLAFDSKENLDKNYAGSLFYYSR